MQYRNHTLNQEHRMRTAAVEAVFQRLDWTAGGGSKGIKRLIDIVVAAFSLVIFSPIFVVIALLIKCADNGPILFWQTRLGLWGHEFQFPKFRSMSVDAEELKDSLPARKNHRGCVAFKMKGDPRVTRIGRVIRKLSLDEFPQLWCVLTGTMSLVGPRPPLPCEVINYKIADLRRLSVTPGLTCIWQVSGRADIPFNEQIALDLQYIETQSVWLDIVLLLRTIPAVLFCTGAY